MKIKTQNLVGPALDWAVAEANGTPVYRSGKTLSRMDMDGGVYWQPTIEWAQGGPIIEREKISLVTSPDDADVWIGSVFEPEWNFNRTGPTPLVAAMRCYVASKLGDEIEVPEELK
jgi:hypothetical protein